MVAVLGFLLLIGGAIAPAASADTMRDREWYLDRMQAAEMWKVSTGKGITVALIDTGVIPSVPELTGKVLPGKNFVEPKRGAHKDKDGHGTAMAMLIAGNGVNGSGVKGLAPDARILPLTVFGSSKEAGTNHLSALLAAIRYAADSEAKIINMSLAWEYFMLDQDERAQIQQAVDYAVQRGKLLLAGSGNTGDSGNYVGYPAATAGVAGIGAVDKTSSVAKFSVSGPQVALAAPGEDIPILCGGGTPGYCSSWGTSQATAIASASAALIWSMHPSWTGNQVLRVLMNTAGKPTEGAIPSRYIGYGTVRPRVAVLGDPGDPGPADVNPLVAARSPKKSPSPSASDAGGSGPSKPSKQPASSAASEKSDDGKGVGAMVWITIGVAVVVIDGAVFLLRRRASALRR
ncbi:MULTISPECIES: type VII secretion-associated serine protease mycosin [unclassified Streptomyces]|uniref:type VII secretion-associated serine protease mycosin n=1 Tax=unclassified Streptomyces TaxID=2593676 RepID=UPI002E1094F0|nr:type VII secretion-associated serine protease mycosin [Streptomyces sp. NBC_01321]WSP55684.1 type VII secretion-associated serine protease mycosin [Streptomyces sp. NBC_01241]WSU23579.1 type VII secretion-associated serine protease mycosin [Streptomyces sp. NBC_01108]